MANPLDRLTRESAVLLVVDIQERLLPAIHDSEAMMAAAGRLIQAARSLEVPILATEQYPAGIGPTCAPIRAAWGDVQPVEKLLFSACVEQVVESLANLDRPHVLVVGIEAHVCIQQTVLDLLRRGFSPHVCADAVSSRRALDRDVALERMRQAGAIVTTTESAIFEMLGRAGTALFKEVLKIIK